MPISKRKSKWHDLEGSSAVFFFYSALAETVCGDRQETGKHGKENLERPRRAIRIRGSIKNYSSLQGVAFSTVQSPTRPD